MLNESAIDLDVTRLIIDQYYRTLAESTESDVIIVGAGPGGLVAGSMLAEKGYRVVIFEKKLSPGGGLWGGGKGMNCVVLENEVVDILDYADIHYEKNGRYLVVSSLLLASGLIKKAIDSGVTIFNLCTIENVYFDSDKRLAGVKVNDSAYKNTNLHVDPLTFLSRLVIDSTGHESLVANCLADRGLVDFNVEDLINTDASEAGKLFNTKEIYPGLIITGIISDEYVGFSRMGPVFGGMLIAGRKASELALNILKKTE